MIRLSVNVNKVATLRNARGGDVPNVCEAVSILEITPPAQPSPVLESLAAST